MEEESIEIGGDLLSDLKEAAQERGITLRELVIHLLLQFVEETDADSDDEELDADVDEPESE